MQSARIAMVLIAAATVLLGCGSADPAPDATGIGSTQNPASSTATYTGPTIADGIYRANVSEQALAEAGVVSHEAAGNGGVQTLTIQSTRFTFEVHQKPPTCTGTL